jgi:polyhydroxybutyrate depolymerase
MRRVALVGLLLLALVGCDRGTGGRTASARARLERHVTVDGRDRRYLLDLPATTAGAPPVIIALHGGLGSPEQFAATNAIVARATADGYVVVHPAGERRTWNAGHCCGPAMKHDVDDVAFVAVLLDDLATVVGYDRARVYAVGHSNGAMMSYRLGCELGGRVVAIAPVAGSYYPERCDHSGTVALLDVHGLDDDRVPYLGGGTGLSGAHPPTKPGVAAWAEANGCSPTPATAANGPVTTITYAGCRKSGAVSLVTIADQGHAWRLDDPVDKAGLVVDFFNGVRR